MTHMPERIARINRVARPPRKLRTPLSVLLLSALPEITLFCATVGAAWAAH